MDNFILVKSKAIPALHVNRNRLTFNVAAVDLLGMPPFISLGLDEQNKKLLVMRKKDNLDTLVRCYPFFRENKPKTISVCDFTLHKKICEICNIKPSRRESFRFALTYDERFDAYTIDLSKQL